MCKRGSGLGMAQGLPSVCKALGSFCMAKGYKKRIKEAYTDATTAIKQNRNE